MKTVSWEECKSDFQRDGSLRDICISPATIEAWRVVFDHVSKQPGGQYALDGASTPLPENVEQAFAAQSYARPSLRMSLGKTLIVFHFFDENEIECDFSPNDIDSQEDFDLLLAFVRKLGILTGREARITEENCPDTPLIIYSPQSDLFTRPAG